MVDHGETNPLAPRDDAAEIAGDLIVSEPSNVQLSGLVQTLMAELNAAAVEAADGAAGADLRLAQAQKALADLVTLIGSGMLVLSEGERQQLEDLLEEALKVAAAAQVELEEVEIATDALVEELAEGRLDARERAIDSLEEMMRRSIAASDTPVEGGDRAGHAAEEHGRLAHGTLLACMLALLHLRDDPFLSGKDWQGGQAFFHVDPATNAKAQEKKPRILSNMEQIVKLLREKEAREAAQGRRSEPAADRDLRSGGGALLRKKDAQKKKEQMNLTQRQAMLAAARKRAADAQARKKKSTASGNSSTEGSGEEEEQQSGEFSRILRHS
jgi:hypothetical protein